METFKYLGVKFAAKNLYMLQERIQRGATGPCPPKPLMKKIKTQMPRTHVGTAATINDHKTAHKHSSLAPFHTYDNTKKRSASGGFVP